MSTRSHIGVVGSGGTISAVYCHNDGEPEGVGQILVDHYGSPDDAKAIIAVGDLSELGTTLKGRRYGSPFDPSTTIGYRRDRGLEEDKDLYASTFADRADFEAMLAESWSEWAYLWDGQQWLCAEVCGPDQFPFRVGSAESWQWQPLKDVLAEQSAEEAE